jgi:peptidoglycan/xylan/chitin deacetylase (PgdA/CDA1 family)
VELARSPLIEVGAHSVTHPVLPNLPLPAQREEITRSKAELEAMTGEPVQGFAYPHGRYTADAVGLVREAGFRYACAVRPQPDGPDPFLLPRVPVGDWDGDTFDRMLRHGFQD